jgi:RNA polymerase sigma factor (sigma-70 family)
METTEVALVAAAQAGDSGAVDELVASYLPLVYNIVGRALSDRADIDDVVQETMLRVLRELPTLRTPASFRLWLVTIAIRQVGTHRRRLDAVAARTTTLDDATGMPADGDFEELAILRLGLSGQRRQAVRAGRWLDPDDRALLSLWWLETAGHLTRTELAAAVGLSIAHAGVRVQRMRNQFELSRSVVAALEADPRCAGLDAVLADWDGSPSPLWRKRIARHTRSCAGCDDIAAGLVPAEQLLLAFALVPVPIALTLALAKQAALAGIPALAAAGAVDAGVKPGLLGQFAHAVVTHPLLAIAITGGLVTGTAAATASLPARPATVAAAAAAGPVPAIQDPGGGSARSTLPMPAGSVSLESANAPARYVTVAGDQSTLSAVAADSPAPARTGATFETVAGLAGAGCVSFRTRDGRYLRHSSWRLRVSREDGTALFRGDATFCARPGSMPGSVSFESQNYPGWYLRHVGDALWVDRSDGSATFRNDSAFHVRAPLTG